MATIELQGLEKRFGEVEVLKDVSLTVGDGEIAALLGPSGCGKSTTLFILAGLYQPSGGKVLFDGASMRVCIRRTETSGWSSRATRCIRT